MDLHPYDKEVAAISSVDIMGSLPVGALADGCRICPPALDLLLWTEKVADFVKNADPQVKMRGLYLAGRATPLAKSHFAELGWPVHCNGLKCRMAKIPSKSTPKGKHSAKH